MVVCAFAAVQSPLDGVLSGRVHPPYGECVYTNLGPHQRVGGVLGCHVQGSLRHPVRGQHRHRTVRGRRRYVNDRPGDFFPFHDASRVLHQEKGRPSVYVHDPVIVLRSRIPERTPIGGSSGIDQDVNCTERLIGDFRNVADLVDVFQVSPDEDRPARVRRQFVRKALAAFLVAAGYNQTPATPISEQSQGRLAQTLCPSRHDRHFALEGGSVKGLR
mmetsp:Transcript_22351/g.53176  ORF Transcript_22351/g.53176 Transcript_22351/m.53176 type:complete len:217 (-) Transcript_22351:128-778(-)